MWRALCGKTARTQGSARGLVSNGQFYRDSFCQPLAGKKSRATYYRSIAGIIGPQIWLPLKNWYNRKTCRPQADKRSRFAPLIPLRFAGRSKFAKVIVGRHLAQLHKKSRTTYYCSIAKINRPKGRLMKHTGPVVYYLENIAKLSFQKIATEGCLN